MLLPLGAFSSFLFLAEISNHASVYFSRSFINQNLSPWGTNGIVLFLTRYYCYSSENPPMSARIHIILEVLPLFLYCPKSIWPAWRCLGSAVLPIALSLHNLYVYSLNSHNFLRHVSQVFLVHLNLNIKKLKTKSFSFDILMQLICHSCRNKFKSKLPYFSNIKNSQM